MVNRGGLFTVNDKAFMLFRAMEIVTQRTLDMNLLHSPNLGELLNNAVSSSENVMRCWEGVTESLTETESSVLFTTVSKYWVKIRVNAYVKVYMNVLKKAEKEKKHEKRVSRKGDKSLRKSLKK